MEEAMKEFNLLYEPWIRVMRSDASVEEVALPDALIRAHEYLSLAGEMPTQDVAILRLLLAVMHAVFSRMDAEGNTVPLSDEDNALDRWNELWQLGKVPELPVKKYLAHYEERFWLFHPERPFYQSLNAAEGSSFDAKKMNGEISESGNKTRIFSLRYGQDKNRLTYSEAARWLIQLNGFDDSALKKKINTSPERPTFKDGWLGQLGIVYATGRNLFETLMLNFVLFDRYNEIWSSSVPIWEQDNPDIRDLIVVTIPHDQAALLTLPSRRICLQRENGYVTQYNVLGGEQFDPQTAIEAEQMTMWHRTEKGRKIEPKLHNQNQQFWRQLGIMIDAEDGGLTPGVIRWHSEVALPEDYVVCYRSVAMKYGKSTPHSAVDDVFTDALSFHHNLLSHLGEDWRRIIVDELECCEKIATYIWWLAINLRRAAGGSGESEAQTGESAKDMFFSRIDIPFRKWLLTLDAKQGDTEKRTRREAWRKELRRLAIEHGQKMVASSGPAAFRGRYFKTKKDKEPSFINSSIAYNEFVAFVNSRIPRSDEHADS